MDKCIYFLTEKSSQVRIIQKDILIDSIELLVEGIGVYERDYILHQDLITMLSYQKLSKDFLALSSELNCKMGIILIKPKCQLLFKMYYKEVEK